MRTRSAGMRFGIGSHRGCGAVRAGVSVLMKRSASKAALGDNRKWVACIRNARRSANQAAIVRWARAGRKSSRKRGDPTFASAASRPPGSADPGGSPSAFFAEQDPMMTRSAP